MHGWRGSLSSRDSVGGAGGVQVTGVEEPARPGQVGAHLAAALGDRAPVDAQRGQRHRAVDVDRDAGVSRRRRMSRRSSSRTSSVRSTANAGTSTLPPRSIVRRTASASRCGSGTGCRRSPYVDSTTIVSAAGGSAGGRSSGWWRRPRSPLKSTRCPSTVSVHRRRAEDVPGRPQPQDDAPGDGHVLVERHRLEQRQGALDVVGVVQREGGTVLGEAASVGVRRVLLLEVGAVAEHDRGELGGLRGAADRPAEALPDQARQVAGVVEVGVGQHHLVDGGAGRRGTRPSCAAAGSTGPGRGRRPPAPVARRPRRGSGSR